MNALQHLEQEILKLILKEGLTILMMYFSGAKFEIFPIQYMDNGMMVWRDEFAKCGVS